MLGTRCLFLFSINIDTLDVDAIKHSRPQSPRSFWSAPRIETSIVQISEAAHKSRKSVIRGLPASVPARGLDPWRRPKGSWALGTRMAIKMKIMETKE